MSEQQPQDALPVVPILEVLQTSNHPEIQKLSNRQWYQVENCLMQPVEVRKMPKYKPAAIVWTDQRFKLTLAKQDENGNEMFDEKTGEQIMLTKHYWVRRFAAGDAFDLSTLGPPIIERFFGGDYRFVAQMQLLDLADRVVAKALSERIQGAMTDLSDAIIEKLCDLAIEVEVDPKNERRIIQKIGPMQQQDLFDSDALEQENARKAILQAQALFFSSISSTWPENIKGVLSWLGGMISFSGKEIGPLLSTLEQK